MIKLTISLAVIATAIFLSAGIPSRAETNLNLSDIKTVSTKTYTKNITNGCAWFNEAVR